MVRWWGSAVADGGGWAGGGASSAAKCRRPVGRKEVRDRCGRLSGTRATRGGERHGHGSVMGSRSGCRNGMTSAAVHGGTSAQAERRGGERSGGCGRVGRVETAYSAGAEPPGVAWCGISAMSSGAAQGGTSATAERHGGGRSGWYGRAGGACAVCSSDAQPLIPSGRGRTGSGAPWERLESAGRGASRVLSKKKSGTASLSMAGASR